MLSRGPGTILYIDTILIACQSLAKFEVQDPFYLLVDHEKFSGGCDLIIVLLLENRLRVLLSIK